MSKPTSPIIDVAQPLIRPSLSQRLPDTTELRGRPMTDAEYRGYVFALQEFVTSCEMLQATTFKLSNCETDATLMTPRQRAAEKFNFARDLAKNIQLGCFT